MAEHCVELPSKQEIKRHWVWPVDPSVYDRFGGLYAHEISELEDMTKRERFGCWSQHTQRALTRLRDPVQHALKIAAARPSIWCTCTTVLLLEMHRRQTSFWAWKHEEWVETLCTTPSEFCRRHALLCDAVRPLVTAVAYLLGRFQEVTALKTINRVVLARNVFGRSRVNAVMRQVVDIIAAWGYGAGRRYDLKTTLGALFLANRSPELGDLTVEFLERQRKLCAKTRLSGSILILSRVLLTLGLTGRALSYHPETGAAKPVGDVRNGASSLWVTWVGR